MSTNKNKFRRARHTDANVVYVDFRDQCPSEAETPTTSIGKIATRAILALTAACAISPIVVNRLVDSKDGECMFARPTEGLGGVSAVQNAIRGSGLDYAKIGNVQEAGRDLNEQSGGTMGQWDIARICLNGDVKVDLGKTVIVDHIPEGETVYTGSAE